MTTKNDSAGENEKVAELSALLAKHRGALTNFLDREAKSLQRHEGVEDLVQGVHMRALRQVDQFDYRGEREFLAWLYLIAKQHIADRRDYWTALRRDGGAMLRITTSDGGGGGGATSSFGVNPMAEMIGPATFAMRREVVALAARAIGCLLPRDQEIVRAVCQGETNTDIAKRIGVEYDAAEKAKARAMERFKKTFELLSRRANPS